MKYIIMIDLIRGNVFLILGEIFSLVAAVLLAYSTFSKDKNKMIGKQIWHAVYCALSNFCLGAYSGLSTNILTGIRNYLTVKGWFNMPVLIIYSILNVGIGYAVNTKGLIGLLPAIAGVEYAIFLYKTKSAQVMRYALILNLLMWVVYDFIVMSYPMFIMDIIIIIVTTINAIRFKREKNN